MKLLYIHQHQALGDHVICNGLCREIIKNKKQQGYTHFVLWTYDWLMPTVSFMFRDLENVEIKDNTHDREYCDRFYAQHGVTSNDTVGINLGNFSDSVNWDQRFYLGQNIPFETRWTSFYAQRDANREKDLYNQINPHNEPYVVVHNRFNLVNYAKIRSDLKRIEISPGITNNAFDYLTLLEKAAEIHVCDSSFKHIVESFDMFKQNLFYHNNPPRNTNHYHTSRKEWIMA